MHLSNRILHSQFQQPFFFNSKCLMYILSLNNKKKPDKIYEWPVFRHWVIGRWAQLTREKGNKWREPYDYLQLTAWREFPFCSIGRGNPIKSWQSLQTEAEFRVWRIQGGSNLWGRLQERRELHPEWAHSSTWFEVISTYMWRSSLGWRKNHWKGTGRTILGICTGWE